MKRELLMQKFPGKLVPIDEASWEVFDSIRTGKPVLVIVEQPRNPGHLRKYWALATAVAKADPDFTDKDEADHWARIHQEDMRREYFVGGRPVVMVEKIDVASMDQLRFTKFYDKALMIWAEKIGMDPEDLLKGAE